MLRILAIFIIIAAVAATCFSQVKTKSEPKYVAARGRCGTVYHLEGEPRFFAAPKTQSEIEYVLRVLKSAPPQADVECRDFTDALSPYLYATRKIEIARRLLQLKRFAEAREELWSVFSNRPIIYGKQKLFYEFDTDEAIELLVGDELWDEKDFSQRLKSGKYFTEDLEKAYRERRNMSFVRIKAHRNG